MLSKGRQHSGLAGGTRLVWVPTTVVVDRGTLSHISNMNFQLWAVGAAEREKKSKLP